MPWIIGLLILGNICSLITGAYSAIKAVSQSLELSLYFVRVSLRISACESTSPLESTEKKPTNSGRRSAPGPLINIPRLNNSVIQNRSPPELLTRNLGLIS